MNPRYELRLVELLGEVRDELRAVRRLLEEERRPRPAPRGDANAGQLVQAIAATAGDRLFTTGELVAHAALPEAATLREAIIAALGRLNAKALGKLLKRIEGCDLDGLTVQRVGDERDGAVWRVAPLRLSKAQTRAVGFA